MIALEGGNPTIYGYVFNSNIELDILGLIIVYRSLNGKQEEQALNNTSIQPKNSSANYSIQEHIDNGNLETQYISTTKRQEIAERYASPNPKRGKTESSTIIEIDTDKLNPKKVCDVSNGINPETGVPLNNPARKWARKNSEVLIHGDIFLMTHIKFIKKEKIIRMEETCYQKEIERIKSMLEDYYNKDFNSEEEDFRVNKFNKELIEKLIVNVKHDDTIAVSNKNSLIKEALVLLAKNTGCAEDEVISEEILNHLLVTQTIVQQDIDYYSNLKSTRRWI